MAPYQLPFYPKHEASKMCKQDNVMLKQQFPLRTNRILGNYSLMFRSQSDVKTLDFELQRSLKWSV